MGQPLRLAGEPLPLFASQTEEDIATFSAFNYDAQLHLPIEQHAYRRCDDTGEDIATFSTFQFQI